MKIALSICAALLLTACGGGGGGGDAPAGVTPLAAITLTAANQAAVTGVAVEVAMGSADLLGLLPVGVQATTTPTVSSRRVLSRLTSTVVQKIAELRSSPAMVTGAVIVENCGPDPSFGTFSFDDFGTTTSGRATFSNCDFELGSVVNGTMNLSGLTETASGASGTADLNMTIGEPGLTPATVTGGFTFSFVGLGTATETATLTGTLLSIVEDAQTQVISNFSFRSAFDVITGVSTDTVSFTVSDSAIGGSITFATVTPFTTTAIALYPSAGVGLITGAESTVIRVTALGDETAAPNSQVRIERSSDGGATYGAATLTTWDALLFGDV